MLNCRRSFIPPPLLHERPNTSNGLIILFSYRKKEKKGFRSAISLPKSALRAMLLALLLLALLAAVVYLPGLDTHGVTNWQEGQRLIVARDMQSRMHSGEGLAALLTPTVHGAPYLAKPPLLYWLTIGVAEARRGSEGEGDGRRGERRRRSGFQTGGDPSRRARPNSAACSTWPRPPRRMRPPSFRLRSQHL